MAISTFYTLNTTNRNSIRTFVDIVDIVDTVDIVDISWCQRVCGEVDQEMNDVQGPRFHSRINFALHSGLSVGCVTTRGNTRTDGQLGAARAHYHHSYQPHTANNITSSLAAIASSTISRNLKFQEISNISMQSKVS